jgi:hypothetical protein
MKRLIAFAALLCGVGTSDAQTPRGDPLNLTITISGTGSNLIDGQSIPVAWNPAKTAWESGQIQLASGAWVDAFMWPCGGSYAFCLNNRTPQSAAEFAQKRFWFMAAQFFDPMGAEGSTVSKKPFLLTKRLENAVVNPVFPVVFSNTFANGTPRFGTVTIK